MVGMFNGLTEVKARAGLFLTLNGCFTTESDSDLSISRKLLHSQRVSGRYGRAVHYAETGTVLIRQ